MLLARTSASLLLAFASLLAAPPSVGAQAWPASELPAARARRVRVPVDGAPARGGSAPLVTIVTFSDFQCPFCGRVQPTLERVFRTYGDDVRLVFRNQPLPFHPDAMPAAEAAMEALAQGGSSKFWAMHDLLFSHQRALSREALEGYARRLDLDLGRFRAALDDHRHRAAIEADAALAERVGNLGTPGFFVNGRSLSGAQPYEVFAAMIDEELAFVREGLAHGVPRAEVYARLQRGGAARMEPPRRAPRPPRPRPDPEAVYRVPLLPGQPVRGRADALVTLVAFTDFECPFCRRAHGTVEELRRRYPRELRVAVRNDPLPFHPGARPAAMALLEAEAQRGPRGYWRMYDLLMGSEARSFDRATLEGYARTLGLDLRRFRRALDEETHAAAIAADQALARQLGAQGTPAFYINGRSVVGAQPIDAFVEVVEEELARARARVRAGTPRRRLYGALIADGATEPRVLAPGEIPTRLVSLPPPADAPSRGAVDAPLVIQLFTDFECPSCAAYAETLDRVLREYDGRVRLVFRDLPMEGHPRARAASEAAREVRRQGGDAAFWRYQDVLYAHPESLDDEALVAAAARVPGIDAAAVRRAVAQRRDDAAIDRDRRALRDAGVAPGVPLTVVGDRLARGPVSLAALRDLIERALEAR